MPPLPMSSVRHGLVGCLDSTEHLLWPLPSLKIRSGALPTPNTTIGRIDVLVPRDAPAVPDEVVAFVLRSRTGRPVLLTRRGHESPSDLRALKSLLVDEAARYVNEMTPSNGSAMIDMKPGTSVAAAGFREDVCIAFPHNEKL